MDAAEYKHVVLGLLFLKYISDAFESRRDELRPNWKTTASRASSSSRCWKAATNTPPRTSSGCRPKSRWPNLQNQAKRPNIATLIDDAILAVERDNPNLKGKLPRDYARRGIAPEKLGGLIDLIADIGFKGDRGQGPRYARPRL